MGQHLSVYLPADGWSDPNNSKTMLRNHWFTGSRFTFMPEHVDGRIGQLDRVRADDHRGMKVAAVLVACTMKCEDRANHARQHRGQ